LVTGSHGGTILLAGLGFCLTLMVTASAGAAGYPVTFIDDGGRTVVLPSKPQRVVSLVPSITEIIFGIDAQDTLKGLTYHNTHPPEISTKTIVGGFFAPSIPHIEQIQPDLIFHSQIHRAVVERYHGTDTILIRIDTDSIADSFDTIRLLGRIFNQEKKAAEIVIRNQRQLEIIARKVARIPMKKRRRVIRLMGRDRMMTPGDDSFQNELIRAAGGIPPKLNQRGNVVPISVEDWQAFDPQMIYGCGGDRIVAAAYFDKKGWKDVSAVKNGFIRYFPCDLTCRCATHTGYFVSWLSSRIYADLYGDPAYQVTENRIEAKHELALPVPYVKKAAVVYSQIEDFDNKSLIVEMTGPMAMVSTLEGRRSGITTVGNHYASPPFWGIGHNRSVDDIRKRVYRVIGKSRDTTSFLFTGADMDNLSVQTETFKAMQVTAIVTAGVRSNALRMSKDTGRFYEPGTINILLLPGMKLTPRAMTRAIISATEAKTAALLDMDIRSSASPLRNRATGTGTDNIIVVEGTGTTITNAGGHTKMGELIAKAVHKGVQESVYRQNGMLPVRNVFQRLKERGISISGLVDRSACDCLPNDNTMARMTESVLLESRFAGFIHTAFALSDDYEKGLIPDLTAFEAACYEMAEAIAEQPIPGFKDLVAPDHLPAVIEMALNALLNGVYHRLR